MKMFLWAIVGLAVAGLAFWLISSTATVPPHPALILVLALIFGISPFGTFWMLYIVIRYEKKPLPYILLAFVPYFSLGYYFERVRGRQMVRPMQDE